MNKIVVNFNPCTPAPPGGYNIKWRVQGSEGLYINAGNFFISPAVFYDHMNPAGTCYEGFIRSNCGGDVLGTPVMWTVCDSGVESGTPAILNAFQFMDYPSSGGSYWGSLIAACAALASGFGLAEAPVIYVNESAIDETGLLTSGGNIYTDQPTTTLWHDTLQPNFIGFRILRNNATGIAQVVDYQTEIELAAFAPEICS